MDRRGVRGQTRTRRTAAAQGCGIARRFTVLCRRAPVPYSKQLDSCEEMKRAAVDDPGRCHGKLGPSCLILHAQTEKPPVFGLLGFRAFTPTLSRVECD